MWQILWNLQDAMRTYSSLKCDHSFKKRLPNTYYAALVVLGARDMVNSLPTGLRLPLSTPCAPLLHIAARGILKLKSRSHHWSAENPSIPSNCIYNSNSLWHLPWPYLALQLISDSSALCSLCWRLWFSDSKYLSESPGGLAVSLPQSLWFSRCTVGLSICISNLFSGDAEAAALEIHFENCLHFVPWRHYSLLHLGTFAREVPSVWNVLILCSLAPSHINCRFFRNVIFDHLRALLFWGCTGLLIHSHSPGLFTSLTPILLRAPWEKGS